MPKYSVCYDVEVRGSVFVEVEAEDEDAAAAEAYGRAKEMVMFNDFDIHFDEVNFSYVEESDE